MSLHRRLGLGFVALGLAALLLTAEGRSDEVKKIKNDATGTWVSKFTPPNGQEVEIVYKLKQEGDKLTGTVKGPGGNETDIQKGRAKDGKISFQMTRERNGQEFTIKYRGTVKGDTITGKVEFGERSRDWKATRRTKKDD